MKNLIFSLTFVCVFFFSYSFIVSGQEMNVEQILKYQQYLEADNKIECGTTNTPVAPTPGTPEAEIFKKPITTYSCVTPSERDRIESAIGVNIDTAKLKINPTNVQKQPEDITAPKYNSEILNQIVPSSAFKGQDMPPLSKVLNQLFYIGLVVAVVLAIVMIIRGGIEYMTTDAIYSKESGKNRVKAALGGLLLAFSTILILNTINPNLTSLNLVFPPLKDLKKIMINGLISKSRTDSNSTNQTNGTTSGSVVKGDFSNITAADIRPYLSSKYSDADIQAFVDAGKQYGVDPRFLASISKLETANGTSKAFNDGRNNAMGISNKIGPIGFSSKKESIFKQAKELTKQGGYYTKADTIQQIGDIYAPAVDEKTGKPLQNDPNGTNGGWAQAVSENYAKMTGGTGN